MIITVLTIYPATQQTPIVSPPPKKTPCQKHIAYMMVVHIVPIAVGCCVPCHCHAQVAITRLTVQF